VCKSVDVYQHLFLTPFATFIRTVTARTQNSTLLLDHQIVLSTGEVVNRWGFVVATINWNSITEQSGMYQRYQQLGREFSLTRRDRLYQGEKEETLLAESPGFQNRTAAKVLSVDLTTPLSEYRIVVKYNRSDATFRAWIIFLTIGMSLVVAVLVNVVLAQKQEMISKAHSQEAKVETERNMTAYFAHELRYVTENTHGRMASSSSSSSSQPFTVYFLRELTLALPTLIHHQEPCVCH